MSARIANSSALGIRSFNLIKDSMLQSDELPLAEALLLSDWPITRPRTWRAMVNRPQNKKELQAIRNCVPLGVRTQNIENAISLRLVPPPAGYAIQHSLPRFRTLD